MKSTKNMCSTNIDETIKLPLVNCLTFFVTVHNSMIADCICRVFKSFNKFVIRKQKYYFKKSTAKKSHISPRYTQDSNQPVKD